MRCEICHENEATVFLTGVFELEVTEVALCAACGEPFPKAATSPEKFSRLLHAIRVHRSRRPSEHFHEVSEQDPRYAREAFYFVRDALATITPLRTSGHVTPTELLDSLRLLALERYGFSARERLHAWGILRTEDFGEIVFALIGHGIFGRRPEDKKEDFRDGYDFASAFPVPRPEA